MGAMTFPLSDPAAIWIVIPVKPLAEGKARLMLAELERVEANRAFLDHVLAVARAAVVRDHVVVVSRDEAVLAIARRAGARAVREEQGRDLNDALASGAAFARARGARGILSVFADLPYLTRQDLEAMVAAFDGCNLVIAPDEAGTGSNALLMAPNAIAYRHGADSFWRHLDAARASATPFRVVRRTGLMRDIDLPAQFEALRATLRPPRVHHHHHH